APGEWAGPADQGEPGSDDEPAALCVEGARRSLRWAVGHRQAADAVEERVHERDEGRLRGARDHHVGVAALYMLEAQSERVEPGQAAGGQGSARTREAVPPHQERGHVVIAQRVVRRRRQGPIAERAARLVGEALEQIAGGAVPDRGRREDDTGVLGPYAA